MEGQKRWKQWPKSRVGGERWDVQRVGKERLGAVPALSGRVTAVAVHTQGTQEDEWGGTRGR